MALMAHIWLYIEEKGRNVPKTICSVTGVMADVVDVGEIQMSLSLSYAIL